MFKKADILLLIILLAIGLIATVFISSMGEFGTEVKISVDGEIYGTYSLSEDKTITIDRGDSYNQVIIKGGVVYMSESSCPNQICVQHSPINSTGESIVCLPNRVLIEITGGEKYDAISR